MLMAGYRGINVGSDLISTCMQVEPLVLKACDTLVEKFGKYASSKQSADVFK